MCRHIGYIGNKEYIDKNSNNFALLALYPKTGRTHQIRVHLKYKGTSLLGDKQYGKNRRGHKKVIVN